LDVGAEKLRLDREISRLSDEIRRILDLLENRDFVTKAPDNIVTKHRERHANCVKEAAVLEQRLAELHDI